MKRGRTRPVEPADPRRQDRVRPPRVAFRPTGMRSSALRPCLGHPLDRVAGGAEHEAVERKMAGTVEVCPIDASVAWDLRRRVLRSGRSDAEVSFTGDADPASIHLGAYVPNGDGSRGPAEGNIVRSHGDVHRRASDLHPPPSLAGVASLIPQPLPQSPTASAGVPSFRLRGMAVDPLWQGRGVGTKLWGAAADRLLQREVEVCWANARDTALEFYVKLGWQVVGGGFAGAQGLPHHLVVVRIG